MSVRREKTVHDWFDLVMHGKLKGLRVVELDKYLNEHSLSKRGKKEEKMAAIAADVLRKTQTDVFSRNVITINEQNNNDSDSEIDGGGDSDSEGDLVLEEFGDSDTSYEEDAGKNEDNDTLPLVVRTRYGRAAGNWNLFQLQQKSLKVFIERFCCL